MKTAAAPDFINFDFPTEDDCRKANNIRPSAATTYPGNLIIREGEAEEARAAFKEAGLTWKESPSSVTKEDMWPEWPGDPD